MIVIMIIGVIYTMSIGKIHSSTITTDDLNLKNLKNYLLSLKKDLKIDNFSKIKLLCLDNCSECNIYIDGKKVTAKTIDNLVDADVKTYRYDLMNGLNEIQKDVYFNKENVQEDVCFSYTINSHGIGDQVIVESNGMFYDYTDYFQGTKIYSSQSELVDAKENMAQEVLR